MNGKIYILTFPSGLRCVGQTSRRIEDRMREYKSRSAVLQNEVHTAIRDCGWENVEVTLIMQGIQTQDALDKAEDAFVILLKTMWPNGLNEKGGGKFTGACGDLVKKKIGAKQSGRKHTREHRDKVGRASEARWEDPEYRAKTIESMTETQGAYRIEHTARAIEMLKAGATFESVGKELNRCPTIIARWVRKAGFNKTDYYKSKRVGLIRDMKAQGFSNTQIASKLKMCRSTVSRWLKSPVKVGG